MLWRISILLAAALVSQAAILPEEFGSYRRTSVSAVEPADRPIWNEYGLEAAEKAEYAGESGAFTLTAYRLNDPTSAFAVFQWQRPASAQSALTSASTSAGSLIQHQNYVLQFEGNKPHPASVDDLYKKLPNVVRSSLPVLHEYLPKKGRVPNSERYLLGRSALSHFEPRISPELAGFEMGAEAQSARYRLNGREVQMTIFSYPTPQMAIQRVREFQKLDGAVVRRSGPMVLVVPEAAGMESAAKLIEGVNYSASFTWNEEVPKATVQDAAEMILAIAMLAIGLIVASVLVGFFLGGSKSFLRRFGIKGADEDFTALHLDRR